MLPQSYRSRGSPHAVPVKPSSVGVHRGQVELGVGVEGQTWTVQCRCQGGRHLQIGKGDLHQKRLEKGQLKEERDLGKAGSCEEDGR